MAFDWKKPTAQRLGRWQPWHKGHTTLFKKTLEQTGQVAIMVRDVGGIIGQDAGGGRTAKQDVNPFDFNFVSAQIILNLQNEGFTINNEYVIMEVPNIVDISYGRGVGYTYSEHDLGEVIHKISATYICYNMRESGKI